MYVASKRSFGLLVGSIADNDGYEGTNVVVVWSLFHGLGQLSVARQISQLDDSEQRKKIISKAAAVLSKGIVWYRKDDLPSNT